MPCVLCCAPLSSILPFPSCSLHKPWPYLLQALPPMLSLYNDIFFMGFFVELITNVSGCIVDVTNVFSFFKMWRVQHVAHQCVKLQGEKFMAHPVSLKCLLQVL